MFNDYRINKILDRKNYGYIYKVSYLFLMIIFIFIYIIFTYQYETYYMSEGVFKDNYLMLEVDIDDINYVIDNHFLWIDKDKYFYQTKKKSSLYIDSNYQNYMYLYLDVYDLNAVNNQVLMIRIIKEKKTLAKYLGDYVKGGNNGIR